MNKKLKVLALSTNTLGALTGLLVSSLLGAQASARPLQSPAAAPIELPNVEDMAVLPGGRWLIASSMSSEDVKPGLYAIETRTRRFEPLYPAKSPGEGASSRPAATAPRSSCGPELAPGEFSGHGLSYRPTSAGHGELYVVNHGGRESIEIFDIEQRGTGAAAPKLTWKSCILLPAGSVGNAVTWTADGTLYATATPVLNGVPQLGGVRSWTSGQGWISLAASGVPSPTGIVAAPDGRKIYVTSFLDRKVVEITLGKEPSRRELTVDFGADNLSWAADGALLAGGLAGKPADIMRSCRRTSSPQCAFTGYVARIDPKTFTLRCRLELGPTTTTTATQVGSELWFGSSRSPRIWRTSAARLASCPTRIDVGAGAATGTKPREAL